MFAWDDCNNEQCASSFLIRNVILHYHTNIQIRGRDKGVGNGLMALFYESVLLGHHSIVMWISMFPNEIAWKKTIERKSLNGICVPMLLETDATAAFACNICY